MNTRAAMHSLFSKPDPRRANWSARSPIQGTPLQPPSLANGFALRLTFAEPVAGPIALGYASHFGLGQFCAFEV